MHELFTIDLFFGTCCIPLFLPFFEFFHLCCHPCQQGKFHKEEYLYLKRCFLLFSYLMEILCVEATKNLPILWLWRKRHTRTHILCGSCKDSLKKTTIKPLYVLFPFPKFPSSNGNKHGFFMTSHGNQNLGTYLIVGLILLLQTFLEETW